MRLQDKVAIITGAASGFGAGIAAKFVAEGATVVIADINRDAATAMATTLGPRTSACHVDVSRADSVRELVADTMARHGSIDILVNNAGIGHRPTPLEQLQDDEFDRIFGVNAKSLYLFAKYLVPEFKRRHDGLGAGVILNIASTAGVSPRPNLTWYNASKGWVITATKSMAVELAPYNIRVNALNPVAGETPLLATFMGSDTPDNRQRFLDSIPLGRFSTPADVGNAACFLCSEEAGLITGVAMEVDGGRCI